MARPVDAIQTQVVVEKGKVQLLDAVHFAASLRRLQPGAGEVLVLRLARPEDAARHAQYKHLFGHILKPVSDLSGYSLLELKEQVKALFLPDGLTSLTEMSAEQFSEFNQHAELHFRTELPEAFADARRAAG